MAKLPAGVLYTPDEVIDKLGITGKTRRVIDTTLYRLRGYAGLVEGRDYVRLGKRSILYTASGLRRLRSAWKRQQQQRERNAGKKGNAYRHGHRHGTAADDTIDNAT